MKQDSDPRVTEAMLLEFAKTSKQIEGILTLTRGVLAMLFFSIPALTIGTLIWMFG